MSLTCTPVSGGAFTGVIAGDQIDLGDGDKCQFTAEFASGVTIQGVVESYTYTPSYGGTAAYLSTTSTVIFGGSFGAAPVAGASESELLDGQQDALSTLVVTASSDALGEAVFGGALDEAFANGAGPLVTATGFAASTRSVAAWAERKRREGLESRLADLPRDADGREVHVTPVAALPRPQEPAWNAWIRGNWTFYDGKGSSFDGHLADVLAGIDYRFDETVVAGLVAGYGNADLDTVIAGIDGAFEADGYTVGPYVGVKLAEHVRFDALAAYTWSDYDNRVGATSGDFSAHRVTVGAQLKGRWEGGDYFVEPGIRVIYAEEYQDAYIDSAAVRHGSRTVRAGRASIGPKAGFVYRTEDGAVIRPWVAVQAEYDFSNQAGTPSSGLPDLDDTVSARVSVGVDAALGDGIAVSLKGEVSGLGSDLYTAYGGSARIDVPF